MSSGCALGNSTNLPRLSGTFTVKPDVLLQATLQYCPTILQFSLADCSEQFATDANKLRVEIHERFVNKASDWTIRKREAPIQLLRLFDWLPSFL